MLYKTDYQSPIGKLMLASDGVNLVGLWIEGQKYFADTISEPVYQDDSLQIFIKTKLWLDRYFSKQKPNINELPLLPSGSEFRQSVWRILREIPYGEVVTYGEIAKRLARQNGVLKMSARAVGTAVGHNPISIIIPCHRVVGKSGNLTGYAGGIEKKLKLLQFEQV